MRQRCVVDGFATQAECQNLVGYCIRTMHCTIEIFLLQYSINCFQNYYCNRYVFSPSAIRFFGQPQVVEPFDRCAQWAHRSNDTVAFFPIFGGALRAAAKNRKKCLKKSTGLVTALIARRINNVIKKIR